MRHTGKTSTETGMIEWLKCEHCGNEQSQPPGQQPIPDIVCRKCGMTTDKE